MGWRAGRGAAAGALAVALLCGAPAGPAAAAPPAPSAPSVPSTDPTRPAAAADPAARADRLAREAVAARQRARRAARVVLRLTAEFERHSAAAREAARTLAAAFEVSAGADRWRARDADRLRAAEVAHAARIRALYAEGGGTGLAVTVLAARDPDDALWRLATVGRVRDDLVRRSGLDVASAGARAARSAAAARAAQDADVRLARALGDLQAQADAAAEALARARATLDRLDAEAAATRAAQAAARRVARAREKARAQRLDAGAAPGALGIPASYAALYRDAATSCPGLPWTLLAAVGQVESGHGRNTGPSSAGAIGPMQFMPATFAAYAVDGGGDGRTDAWDPADAIWTAARYLCASGAEGGTPQGVRRALFAYNRAQWYVDLVLATQAAVERRAVGPA